ncbi:single-stranded DNA-binding protein [Campylobacter peloridis]|uniref:Single-stranded DNA-binding protein n=1 Tax=Campylobacter peloridis TaxID=488546 RepID=A0ABX6TT64_9BACT|nr:single-stranded DNA-binding protein [Campylobacter peloridis]AJC84872.1 single-stranded DNA binding protein [Campylobacter peloridis LMG 23910]MBX1886363.1 single-stranded DNA-binding protein [Campylobacter peloridis]QOQ88907.1 single-stranded DNA-binding protein [Campylobacter peloridis]
MFNKVVLVGNLTRDIEMRYAPSGSAIGSSAIAVTRKFSTNMGEKREETCFIDISFFGRTAEIANQYLGKGSKVLIEGRLRFEQWSDQNGQNRSKHSVQVENLEMLGSAMQNNQQNNFASQNHNQNFHQEQSYDPYAAQAQTRANPSQNSYHNSQKETPMKEIDIDKYDDDTELPF